MSAAKAKPQPKLGKDVVYLDHDDQITTIIDKVEGAKQKLVALVLPKRFTTLQSIVNMRLLKRSADNADKVVVLITSEAALLPLAGAAGLHVAKNLQSKPAVPPSPIVQEDATLAEDPADPDEAPDKDAKLDYHRSIGELASAHEVDEPESIPLNDEEATAVAPTKVPKNKKLKVPNFDRFRLLLGAGVFGLVGLIIFLFMATTVWPKATIIMKTTSTPVSAEFSLSAADTIKTLDEAKKEIPAQLKKSDQTSNQQVQATGQKNLGQKASGQVTLRNCVDDEISVPAVSGVTSGGITYITQKTVALDDDEVSGGNCKADGKHTAKVDVVAQGQGAKYNAGKSSSYAYGVSCPQCTRVDARSEGISGGTDNIVTIVGQADLDNAKKKITAAETDKFSNDFQKQLGEEGFYVLTSTLKLTDPVATSNPAIGQEATNVNVNIKITYTVLVVPKADLEKVVLAELDKQIDKSRQEISDEDVLEKLKVDIVNQTSPSVAGLEISIDTTAVPIIDQASVKKQIAGKKDGEIRKILGDWPGVETVETKMSPFWVTKSPDNPSKVTIKLEAISEDNGR